MQVSEEERSVRDGVYRHVAVQKAVCRYERFVAKSILLL